MLEAEDDSAPADEAVGRVSRGWDRSVRCRARARREQTLWGWLKERCGLATTEQGNGATKETCRSSRAGEGRFVNEMRHAVST